MSSSDVANDDQVRSSAGSQGQVSRRTFLRTASIALAGPAVASLSCAAHGGREKGPVRFGIVTDCHYADAAPSGTRFYRESLAKLAECVTYMKARRVDFLIELGDFKDQNTPPVEEKTLAYLRAIEGVFQRFDGPTYHVLGNHDLDSLSKRQFLATVENADVDRGRSYYSFEAGCLHGVVLDANFTGAGDDYDHGNFDWTDANIPAHELDWLEDDLAAARGPVVVFTHQLLDGTGPLYVNNAADVRDILHASGKVRAVFQGHHHAGDYNGAKGIHYYTLKALVEGSGAENNAYAVVEMHPDGSMGATGCRRAVTRRLPVLSPARGA